ncbi:hypothetical protein NDU88_001100 [Pleurodeles waltl]|uniref:Uncharacterized protein n=1 Tax=Pleurodeles waltl TaxID=8319 RepID=A0AAV7VVY8_PLEWA|nr:hypothetical protein NDU88_001100 [Pleurodeles waltl]
MRVLVREAFPGVFSSSVFTGVTGARAGQLHACAQDVPRCPLCTACAPAGGSLRRSSSRLPVSHSPLSVREGGCPLRPAPRTEREPAPHLRQARVTGGRRVAEHRAPGASQGSCPLPALMSAGAS